MAAHVLADAVAKVLSDDKDVFCHPCEPLLRMGATLWARFHFAVFMSSDICVAKKKIEICDNRRNRKHVWPPFCGLGCCIVLHFLQMKIGLSARPINLFWIIFSTGAVLRPHTHVSFSFCSPWRRHSAAFAAHWATSKTSTNSWLPSTLNRRQQTPKIHELCKTYTHNLTWIPKQAIWRIHLQFRV